MQEARAKARGFHNTVAQGGYFGWNLDALDDCLSGGFAAGGTVSAGAATDVFGKTARTAALLKCLRSSGRAIVAWHD